MFGLDYEAASKTCTFIIEWLTKWCDLYRVEINWIKTFTMIVTNRSITLPKIVKCGLINIEVVDSFKLLGVIIDNKLSFKEHTAKVYIQINKILYSIKRIFYLSFDVKIQFFKTFILPYFDYCLSIIIYFGQEAIKNYQKCSISVLKSFLNLILILCRTRKLM